MKMKLEIERKPWGGLFLDTEYQSEDFTALHLTEEEKDKVAGMFRDALGWEEKGCR